MNADKARQLVLEAGYITLALDYTEVFKLIEKESKKGNLECLFIHGDSTTKRTAIHYMNTLKVLGFHCRPENPFRLWISWDPNHPKPVCVPIQ